jgi:hypothetical protein
MAKASKAFHIPKKDQGQRPTVQVAVRIDPVLAKHLRVYAVTNDVLIQDVVEAGIKAVIGEPGAA